MSLKEHILYKNKVNSKSAHSLNFILSPTETKQIPEEEIKVSSTTMIHKDVPAVLLHEMKYARPRLGSTLDNGSRMNALSSVSIEGSLRDPNKAAVDSPNLEEDNHNEGSTWAEAERLYKQASHRAASRSARPSGAPRVAEARKRRRLCSVPSCPKTVKTRGLCWAHGGKVTCKHPACIKGAKSGGYCVSHGGGVRCPIENCNKLSLQGGTCWKHGGGKRCAAPNCFRAPSGGDYCRYHGPPPPSSPH